MRLFKLLLHSLGLTIAIIFAFRHHHATPELQYPAEEVTTLSSNTTVSNVVDPQFSLGKKLFKNNCATCHNKNMKDDMTGPALIKVRQRWADREAVLYDWIRNPGKVLASGDVYALNLFNKWNRVEMTAFPNLSDEEITAILHYTENVQP